MEGFGKFIYTRGDVYEGTWKANQMNGTGKFTTKLKSIYNGNFINDSKEGFGQYTWPDGRRYVGQWKKGVQHGEGKYV